MGCRLLWPIIEIIFQKSAQVLIGRVGVLHDAPSGAFFGVDQRLIINLLPWQSIVLKYWFVPMVSGSGLPVSAGKHRIGEQSEVQQVQAEVRGHCCAQTAKSIGQTVADASDARQ